MDVDFRRAEAPFIPEIERVIRAICNAEQLEVSDEISRGATYFLGLRGTLVLDFLMDLDVEIGGPATPLNSPDAGPLTMTIIPFPALPAHEVMQWLLIDWWREHGADRACCDRLLLETLPWEDEHGRV